MTLTWENDEEKLDQWLIRDLNTDNRDIVAIVPKTGDEDYDNEVTFQYVKLFASAQELLEKLEYITEYLEFHAAEPIVSLPEHEVVLARCKETIAKVKG